MNHIYTAAAALLLMPAAAYAGGYVEPTPAPAPLPVPAPQADWTGAYGGVALGFATGDYDDEFDNDDPLNDTHALGFFAGYLIQNGNFVYGGEVAYFSVDDMFLEGPTYGGDDTVDYLIDGRGIFGYASGNIMFYGGLGWSYADMSINGVDGSASASGLNAGLGVNYLVNDNFFVGVDYTARFMEGENDTVGNEYDLEADVQTLSLRAAFRF